MRAIKLVGAASIVGGATLAANAYTSHNYTGEVYAMPQTNTACVSVSAGYDPCTDVFFVLDDVSTGDSYGTEYASDFETSHAVEYVAVPAAEYVEYVSYVEHAAVAEATDHPTDFAISLDSPPSYETYEVAYEIVHEPVEVVEYVTEYVHEPAVAYVATASYVLPQEKPAEVIVASHSYRDDLYIGRINGPDYKVMLDGGYEEAPTAMAAPKYESYEVVSYTPEPKIVPDPAPESYVIETYEVVPSGSAAAAAAVYEPEPPAPAPAPAPAAAAAPAPAAQEPLYQTTGSGGGGFQGFQTPAYITEADVIGGGYEEAGPSYAPEGFSPQGEADAPLPNWFNQG